MPLKILCRQVSLFHIMRASVKIHKNAGKLDAGKCRKSKCHAGKYHHTILTALIRIQSFCKLDRFKIVPQEYK
jgi:hypothetical protein